MRARYLGPVIVVSRNRGGAYINIVAELDGSVFDRPVAAFRVIPYFARTSIPVPSVDNLIDISKRRLLEMEQSEVKDPDDNDDEPIVANEPFADD